MTEEPTTPLEGIIVSADADPGGQLVSVKTRPVLEIFTTPGLVQALLEAIRSEAFRDFVADLTTEKGRKAIASRARRVASTKVYLDDLGKNEVARLKELPKTVDAGRKELRDGLEVLQGDVRKDLDGWEARMQALKERLSMVQNLPTVLMTATAEQIRAQVQRVEAINPEDGTWDELAREAASVKLVTMATILEQLDKAEKREADAAELERLRKEKADRDAETERERLRQEGDARARQQLAQAPPTLSPEAMARVSDALSDDGPRLRLDSEEAFVALAQEIGVDPGVIAATPMTVAQADTLRRGEPAQPTLEARALDVEHRRAFNREALADMEDAIADVDQQTEGWESEAILRAIVIGKVRHITITY